jgi:hypothetical protein
MPLYGCSSGPVSSPHLFKGRVKTVIRLAMNSHLRRCLVLDCQLKMSMNVELFGEMPHRGSSFLDHHVEGTSNFVTMV